jgi:uncharacterized protein
MASGIEMHEAHFPGRAPIDFYGNGGFRFADMSHKGSILCLPSGIYAWDVSGPDLLLPDKFGQLLLEVEAIEILLVGTGPDLLPLKTPLKDFLREHSISGDPMNTGAAVRTYNVLLAEKRAVAAALIAVE